MVAILFANPFTVTNFTVHQLKSNHKTNYGSKILKTRIGASVTDEPSQNIRRGDVEELSK